MDSQNNNDNEKIKLSNMSIRVDKETQNKFRDLYNEYNYKNKKSISQNEFFKILLDEYENNKFKDYNLIFYDSSNEDKTQIFYGKLLYHSDENPLTSNAIYYLKHMYNIINLDVKSSKYKFKLFKLNRPSPNYPYWKYLIYVDIKFKTSDNGYKTHQIIKGICFDSIFRITSDFGFIRPHLKYNNELNNILIYDGNPLPPPPPGNNHNFEEENHIKNFVYCIFSYNDMLEIIKNLNE